MAVTREQFMRGLTYTEFTAQMTRNQDRFAANERTVEIDPATGNVLRHLTQNINVLVIAEDWCGDVIDNLPILGRLASESSKMTIRIFLRDQNLELMDQYLKNGEFRSIPVFVFFDDEFNEIGRFIERPDRVTERRAQRRRQIYAERPEFGSPDAPVDQLPENVRVELQQAIAEMRSSLKPIEVTEVIQDLTKILERVAA